MNRRLFGKLARNKRLYATNLDYKKIPKASANYNKRDKVWQKPWAYHNNHNSFQK